MNERYVFIISFTRSQKEQANDDFTVSPVGTGEAAVCLAPCCQPLLRCPPTGTHHHRSPRSSPRKDRSHLRALPMATKAGASLTGSPIQTGSLAPSLPVPDGCPELWLGASPPAGGQSSLQRDASLPLPMTCTLSFGAGCCGNRWHGPSRSSPDRAGNCDTAGSGSETPSCSRCGSRNTRRGGRLRRRKKRRAVKQSRETCSKILWTKPQIEG